MKTFAFFSICLLALLTGVASADQPNYIFEPLPKPLKLPPGNVETLPLNHGASFYGDQFRIVDCSPDTPPAFRRLVEDAWAPQPAARPSFTVIAARIRELARDLCPDFPLLDSVAATKAAAPRQSQPPATAQPPTSPPAKERAPAPTAPAPLPPPSALPPAPVAPLPASNSPRGSGRLQGNGTPPLPEPPPEPPPPRPPGKPIN